MRGFERVSAGNRLLNTITNRQRVKTMKITKEISFSQFEPWSGAVDTYNLIVEAGKEDELEAILEDLYPDGPPIS